MRPNNDPVYSLELLVRNVYHTSQYSNSSGLKSNYLYPNFRKESTYFKGKHSCRVSVQRLCYGKWPAIIKSANQTKNDRQILIGFGIANASVPAKYGFQLEPADHDGNPFHAHIYIPELDLSFPNENIEKVMNPGLRRRIDCMTEDFEFLTLDELDDKMSVYYGPDCKDCLSKEDEYIP